MYLFYCSEQVLAKLIEIQQILTIFGKQTSHLSIKKLISETIIDDCFLSL